jgi:hypothetical protein
MTDAFAEKGKKNVFHGVKNSDGKKPSLTDPKYADAPFVDTDDGKSLEDVKTKFAPNADKPTSASAEKGQKKLPEIMQKVDPQKKAQVIPEMYKQMQQLRNVLNAGAASGGGGGGDQNQNNQGNPGGGNATVNPFLEDALTGAFANFSKKYGFERVIQVILSVLVDGGLEKIDSIYKQIVINATLNFIKMALYYGPDNIPVTQYELVPEITSSSNIPTNIVEYSEVPSLYVRQWYVLETDPYPSYIEWQSPDGATKIYTVNDSVFYFSSSNEELYYTLEIGLTTDLDIYFSNFYILVQGVPTYYILTPKILSDILNKYALIAEQKNIDYSLGKDAGSGIADDSQNLNNSGNQGGGGGGGMGQMMGMLQGQLGGKLKDHMQNIMQKQLPKSVNDQQKVQKNIQLSTQDMANNKKGFDSIEKMFGQDSGGNLGGMDLQSMMKGFQSGGGGSSGSGAGGGSSGGGGGGAGSGVPSGSGPYDGGDISDSGLTQIESLLTLLGIS